MKKLKALGLLLLALLISGWVINQYLLVKTRPFIFREGSLIPAVEAVVVPGASVYRSGKLSPVLRQRMEAATRFLGSRPGVKLVLSGHAVPNGYNEAQAMAEFARRKSVPQGSLLLDERGRSTYVTLLHCRRELGLRKILVVSQEYHLARAIYLARGLGMEAYGLAAAADPGADEFHPREYVGRFKDFILLKIARYFNAD